MIINTRSEGLLRVHVCYNCKIIQLNQSDLVVFHIKKGMEVGIDDNIDNNTHYTNTYQQVLYHL